LPGQKIWFLCSNRPLSVDIPARLKKKGIVTSYIRGYFHGNLTKERIDYLSALIDPHTPKNLDRSPHLIRLMFTQWFTKFGTSPTLFIISTLLMSGMYFLWISKEEFVLFSTGCINMGSEVLVIFSFQIFFGYIYLQIGLIITVFLVGLLPGAWIGERIQHQGKKILILTDLALILFLIGFIIAVFFIGDHIPVFLFLIFGLMVSVACGCQFPVALHLRGSDTKAVRRIFSADLMGAAFGVLFTSLVMLPYFGVLWAAGSLILLKLFCILVMGTRSFGLKHPSSNNTWERHLE
jgi:spermidine synthase